MEHLVDNVYKLMEILILWALTVGNDIQCQKLTEDDLKK